MARPAEFEKLSGTIATNGLTALSAYPTLTEIHDVPAGESHEIWLTVANNNNSTDIELLGNFGPDADSFNFEVTAQDTRQVLAGALLIGPATVDIGAVSGATNVHYTGRVKRHRFTS